MLVPSQIAGVILAGGRSRRFGGGDKGLSDLGGKPVLAHVIERFQPQVGRLVLNANGDMSRFADFGLDVISDNESPEHGPLSGVLAALDWATQQNADFKAVVTVSTDVPFLPSDLVQKLESARGAGVAIASSGGQRQPTIAIWPLSVRPSIVEALHRSALSVDALAAKLNAVIVEFPDREISGAHIDPFFNINTQNDLAHARALIGQPQGRK
jgi:molybdopterin-guanine dinucleotide biosynthesis protein A